MADAEATIRALESGHIPPGAASRLSENAARQGTPRHLFTSNLSPSELLLTNHCGYEPLGQVMGTTVYHVGLQYVFGYGMMSGLPPSQELGILTQAYFDARALTFARLMEEGAILRADGIVGVRFERIQGYLEGGMLEFKAIGTAVRQIGSPPSDKPPFVSNLNGQDHWALRQAGYKPVGFAFGNCSWFQVSSWLNQSLDQSAFSPNQELPDFTQGVYQARELAMERLLNEARRLRADGVVGVTVEPEFEFIELQSGYGRHMIAQFTVFGTAIASDGRDGAKISPTMVIPLSDR